MMKKMMNWVLAATLFCGTMAFMTGCKEAKAQESDSKPKVVSTELIRTSQSWDGVELPQGELTIIGQDGKTKVVHEGEAVVEMVGTIHHGENRGTKDCILYMFYLSQKDLPLAVQHPEIPLE